MSKLEKLKQELKTKRDWKSVEEVENFFDESLDTAYELGREEGKKNMSKQKILEKNKKIKNQLNLFNFSLFFGYNERKYLINYFKDLERVINREFDKIKQEQRKEIIEEIESLINSKHCQARKAYHKDSWDAGFHDCLFSISRELLEDYLTINKNNN